MAPKVEFPPKQRDPSSNPVHQKKNNFRSYILDQVFNFHTTMEDEELLYMNDDEMEKTFVRPTSEAPKRTPKKGTKKAFVKANKKTDETKATEEDWDADVIDGLLNNETVVKALHELEQPDKENVKPTVDQHNNVDSTNNVDKGAAKK